MKTKQDLLNDVWEIPTRTKLNCYAFSLGMGYGKGKVWGESEIQGPSRRQMSRVSQSTLRLSEVRRHRQARLVRQSAVRHQSARSQVSRVFEQGPRTGPSYDRGVLVPGRSHNGRRDRFPLYASRVARRDCERVGAFPKEHTERDATRACRQTTQVLACPPTRMVLGWTVDVRRVSSFDSRPQKGGFRLR